MKKKIERFLDHEISELEYIGEGGGISEYGMDRLDMFRDIKKALANKKYFVITIEDFRDNSKYIDSKIYRSRKAAVKSLKQNFVGEWESGPELNGVYFYKNGTLRAAVTDCKLA